jgi:hypothetical protein
VIVLGGGGRGEPATLRLIYANPAGRATFTIYWPSPGSAQRVSDPRQPEVVEPARGGETAFPTLRGRLRLGRGCVARQLRGLSGFFS